LVPNSWEEAWFDAAVDQDADQDAAALADAVALQSRPTLPVDTVAAVLSSSHGQLTDVISSVEDLFDRPAAAILPTPAARTPALRPAPAKERRSARFRAKPAMPAMDKAIRVLNLKLGIADAEMPLEQARRLYYVDSYYKSGFA
jgi:hypothetical protein